MNFKNIKIKTQLAISFLVIILTLCLMSIYSYLQINEIKAKTESLYQNTYTIESKITEIYKEILYTRIEYRNILHSKDKESMYNSINKRNSHYEKTKYNLNLLKGYFSDLDPIIDKTIVYLEEWNSIHEEKINNYSSFLGTEEKNNIIFRQIINESIDEQGSVGQAKQKLITNVEAIQNLTKKKANYFFNKTNSALNRVKKTFIAVVIFSFLIITLSNIFISRNIRLQINELLKATDEFKKGNFSKRSNYNLDNEFGLLSTSLNTLAASVQKQYEMNENINEITTILFEVNNAKDFCDNLLKALLKKTKSQIGAIYILNEQKTNYIRYTSIGIKSNKCKVYSAVNFDGDIGIAASTKKIQHLKDIPADTNLVFSSLGIHALPKEIINIPIFFDKETVTVISIASLNSYESETLEFIDKIKSLIAARMYSVFTFNKLELTSKNLETKNIELELQSKELNFLASELKQQNLELETQKAQLNQANKLKSSFISNMSHELRTPLNSVIALSGVLSKNLKDNIKSEYYNYIEIIERNGKHLLNLINDILSIQKIKSGQEELFLTEFNLNSSIQEIIDMLKPQADKDNLLIVFNKCEKDINVTSEYKKFFHIFQNIIGNAIKFTEVGKVEITIKQLDNNIVIEVADSGIGIKKDFLEFIFDEFKQGDVSTTKKYEGTGLGLSIAKRYTEMLKGKIEVETELNKGSKFIITIPIDLRIFQQNENHNITISDINYQLQKSTPETAKTLHHLPSDIKILIIEDNEVAVIQIEDILQTSGYITFVAKNGFEALEKIETLTPDVIILDLMMPEQDGFECLKELRLHPKTLNIPIIILTAKYITKTELAILKKNSVYQILQKGNVERTQLLNTISNIFRKKNINSKNISYNENMRENHTVLIVEDNQDNITTLKSILPPNIDIIETTDGSKAIDLAITHKPTLIFMDLILGSANGIDIMKQMRLKKELSKTPIIIITASTISENKNELLELGFDDYISKPIDLEIFMNIVNKYLL